MELTSTAALGVNGACLSTEESSALNIAALQRKNQEDFSSDLCLWGKVTGEQADYLVAYQRVASYPFPTKKFYYMCTDKVGDGLVQMPGVSEEFAGYSEAISTPFKGNASFLYPVPGADGEDEAPPETGEDGEEIEVERFSEGHRLAYMVAKIDKDVAVVPKGAYQVDAAHQVVPAAAYAGLPYAAAGELRNYFHLRAPESARAKAALAKPGLVRESDFMDPLTADQPSGAWSLTYDPSHTLATLRSFYWPGYFFFSKVGKGEFGGVYVGDGLPNLDLAFML